MMHPDLPYERNRIFLKSFRFSLQAHQHVCVLSVPLTGDEGKTGRGAGGGVPCVFLPFHTPLCPWAEEREKERRKKRVERHVK